MAKRLQVTQSEDDPLVWVPELGLSPLAELEVLVELNELTRGNVEEFILPDRVVVPEIGECLVLLVFRSNLISGLLLQ